MSVLSRFKDIMASNINALLDKCENPEKMIDQYLRDLTEDLAKVKEETAGIMAEETRCERLVDANKAEITKYEDLAKKALLAGNEGDARVFVAKKQSFEEKGIELVKTYNIAHDNANKMRDMHDKLTRDIQDLEQRRQTVRAKMAVAKTQERINDITSSLDSANRTMNGFERMEAKADAMLDKANAMAELNKQPADSAEALENKYEGAAAPVVDDEIARLKAELGL